MTIFVALLRAIGPATHPKMSMAALREAAERAGFAGATTVGNTGNLLVRSEASEGEVRGRLQGVVDGFGIASQVFVRSAEELAALVRRNPFPEAAAERPSAVGVCFFHTAPRWPDIEAYDGPERVLLVGRELVVDYGARITGGRLDPERRLGQKMTQRNWRVVANLAIKAGAQAVIPRRR
jgi:uncharacterized protein (DUF1697 family)